MHAHEISEEELFGAIEESGARALLIGRRAMVAIGFPVLTAGYDFWLHIEDIEKLNQALSEFEMSTSHAPEEARKRGRYVIENGEHIDVLIARSVTAVDGDVVTFDQVWKNRQRLLVGTATAHLPSLADLIRTKRFASRDKDVADTPPPSPAFGTCAANTASGPALRRSKPSTSRDPSTQTQTPSRFSPEGVVRFAWLRRTVLN